MANLAYLVGLRGTDDYLADPPAGFAGRVFEALPEGSRVSLVKPHPPDIAAIVNAGVGIEQVEAAQNYAGGGGSGSLVVRLAARDPVLLDGTADTVANALRNWKGRAADDVGTFSVLRCAYAGQARGIEDDADNDVLTVALAFGIAWKHESA